MKHEGKELWGAIGGNYMIDADARNPLLGPRLLKKFLSGPQEFSMSDTANDRGKKMWEGLGGSVSYLHSIHWMRPLCPAQLATSMLKRKGNVFTVAGALAKPFGVLADLLVTSVSGSPLSLQEPEGYVKEIHPRDLLNLLQQAASVYDLVPVYTAEVLSWILQKAGEKRQFGPLRCMGVYSKENTAVGWFLYYPNAGGIGQVLQLGTTTQSLGGVLKNLFADAKENGSLALIGRLEPRFLKEFTDHACIMFHRSNYFVMHSRNAALLHSIHRGTAFLTRMEGEWWTPLQGDRFD
jgi:hypothetical protein